MRRDSRRSPRRVTTPGNMTAAPPAPLLAPGCRCARERRPRHRRIRLLRADHRRTVRPGPGPAGADRRAAPHIGGNAYSQKEPETGIEITATARTCSTPRTRGSGSTPTGSPTFTGYQHRVFSVYKGRVYPLPINLATICEYFGAAISPDEARALIAEQAAEVKAGQATNLEQKAVSLVGRPLYEAFIRGYTFKQWQTDPVDLPPEIITRLPVRYTFNNRYFSDTFEGLPADGYTAWLERIGRPPEHRGEAGHRLLRPAGGRGGQRARGVHRSARRLLRLRRGGPGLAYPRLRAGGPRHRRLSRGRPS
jgi:UDP-galactopyranose mutase